MTQIPLKFPRLTKMDSNYFLKILFVVKLRKIISPSLLTCFYPRFRLRLRLGMYFLNLWPKITQHPLSWPRFQNKDSRFIYTSKINFLVSNLSKNLPINFNTTLNLPYTFLGCHGFLVSTKLIGYQGDDHRLLIISLKP
jgi:hypothetical protein